MIDRALNRIISITILHGVRSASTMYDQIQLQLGSYSWVATFDPYTNKTHPLAHLQDLIPTLAGV